MIPEAEIPEMIRPFYNAIRHLDDFPRRFATLVGTFTNRLDAPTAGRLAVECRKLLPADPVVWHYTENAVRKCVPEWHFSIIRDQRRNRVYEEALKAFVTSNTTVLEIGTGSGILAMLAARAGAKHVYTVEINPLVARIAAENIKRNGFEKSITVVNKDALAVIPGTDIPEPCHLLVHEIIPNTLLGENIIPLVEHAKSHLLRPNAVLLPHCLSARAVVVREGNHDRSISVSDVSGFSLSSLDWLGPETSVHVNFDASDILSRRPVDICTLRLDGKNIRPGKKCVAEFPIEQQGNATGLLQWIRFQFPNGAEYENQPGTSSCWGRIFHPFRQTVPVSPGDSLAVNVEHDNTRLFIGLES